MTTIGAVSGTIMREMSGSEYLIVSCTLCRIIPKYLFSSVNSLQRKMFFNLDIKSRHFYIHITHQLKVVDTTTAEFDKSIEWASNSPGLNSLSCLEQASMLTV
jgi:hypothetical protein